MSMFSAAAEQDLKIVHKAVELARGIMALKCTDAELLRVQEALQIVKRHCDANISE